VGASGNELLLKVHVEGNLHRFLVDSEASLRLIKSGFISAEIKLTDLAARGITGTKLKSIGTQEVEIVMGNRIYTHEFLVPHLMLNIAAYSV
jgi:hypothetical protein